LAAWKKWFRSSRSTSLMTVAARPRVERSFLKACPWYQRLVIAVAEKEYQEELKEVIR